MFESRLLDFFSRVHPMVPVLIFVPGILAFFYAATLRMTDETVVAWVFGGYLFWTLTEYWLHRVVFHFEPDTAWGARLHWIIHGVHHDHPNDPLRLVMPPSVSVPLAALFYALFLVVLGTPEAFAVAAGFFSGYLGYDMTHYHLHHHKARTRVGKYLRELHMRHHFQDHERGFGVSAPYWDRAFGTSLRRGRK
ncbi:MAG: sterol desaturase family protein [Thermoleophilaceae bacterium]|nr:sterol desaturase family protein [Thermoleophilaceae bacterium]